MMSNISRWLLLVSIILQISNLGSDFVFGAFFYTPCIHVKSLFCEGNSAEYEFKSEKFKGRYRST